MPEFGLKSIVLFTLLAVPGVAQRSEEHNMPSDGALWPGSIPVVEHRSPGPKALAGTVSAELLRYPLSARAQQMLQKALHTSKAGDHAGAVEQLQKTLAKCPGTGAYVYSLLGVEYLKTHQIPEAVDALEQAVALLPHDASNHANLGLALASSGRYDDAEPELKRALDLNPHSATASELLNAIERSRSERVSRESQKISDSDPAAEAR